MLTHLLRDCTKPDACKVVDRETRVLRVVQREHTAARFTHVRVLEPFRKHLEAHLFHDFLQHDLGEDTRTARCVILVHFDHVKHAPADRVRRDQVSKEA